MRLAHTPLMDKGPRSRGALFSFRPGRRRRPTPPPLRTTGVPLKEEAIELEGVISEILPSAMFRVALDGGHVVIATLAGKMRRFRIRVLAGDRVKVDVSPYDLTRGRITYRHKT